MTAFEIASLEFQATGLVFQEMGAWAGPIAAVVVGLLQCGLLFRGLRMMEGGDRERAAAMEQQYLAENKRRREEAMAALATQRRALETAIERAAPAALRREA